MSAALEARDRRIAELEAGLRLIAEACERLQVGYAGTLARDLLAGRAAGVADRLAELAALEAVRELLAATERGFSVERLPAPKMDGTYWYAFDRRNRGAVVFGATAVAAAAALAEAVREGRAAGVADD